MTVEKIRIYIPVDFEISAEHLAMVMSPEWQDSFYEFKSKEQFALYAARLMTVAGSFRFNDPLNTVELNKFDGHCTDDPQGDGSLTLAPEDDKGWNLETIQEFVENI